MSIETLGDYTLLKKLGEGGFGEVYLAEHRFIKKKFAIKVLLDELSSDSDFIEKFQDNVNILTKLDHPSIIKVHNISSFDGKYFLVLDHVLDSEEKISNLETYLSKQNEVLPEKTVETILRQIASALDYAHQISFGNDNLVHRGIKLSNILVDENDKAEKFYLTDFGLSNLIGETKILKKSYEAMLSANEDINTAIDNYSFLSPEQKHFGKIDFRSDVYSFGVLAYYLITRNFPEGYFEMPSKIAPEYKLNWDLFISKCLQRDPIRRPDQLTKALNTLLPESGSDASNMNVLSWEEVERKVENAMQMSFEFSYEDTNDGSQNYTNQEETVAPTFTEEAAKPIQQLKPVIKPQEIKRPQYEPDPGAIFQKELNVSYYQPKKVEIKNVEPILTEMKIIPGGVYFRGSNDGARDEIPRHKISLSSFAMDVHPITNEQFVRFLESMGGEKDCDNNDIIRLRDSRIKRSAGKLTIESGYSKHPVVGVTWYGAVAYAKWVGKRIPTEAEWEIACMGGVDAALYASGEDIDHSQANFFSSDTTAVKSYPSNNGGLYDMAGNVYEWCYDWYAYNYYDTSLQEPENPLGPQQGVYRVLRGGCWKSLKEDLRCAHRHRNNPGAVNSTYGFRCATDVS